MILLLWLLAFVSPAHAQVCPEPLPDDTCTYEQPSPDAPCMRVCPPISSTTYTLLAHGSRQRNYVYNPAQDGLLVSAEGAVLVPNLVRAGLDDRFAPGPAREWFTERDAALGALALGASLVPFERLPRQCASGDPACRRYSQQRVVFLECALGGLTFDPASRFLDRSLRPERYPAGGAAGRSSRLFTHSGLALFASQSGCLASMQGLTREQGWGGPGRRWRYVAQAGSLFAASWGLYGCPLAWNGEHCELARGEVWGKFILPAVWGASLPHLRRLLIGHRKAIFGRGQRRDWRERGP